jgi:hypothetical protein
VCGAVSGGLAVIDIDAYRSDKLLSIMNLEKLKSETLVVETPSGGYHIYFSCTGPVPSFNIIHQGEVLAEVRGDGRYVLAPPSRAVPKSGGEPKQYRAISSAISPAKLSVDIRTEMLRILKRHGFNISINEESPALLEKAISSGKPYRGRPMPCIEKLAQGVSAGFRNEAAMRMASFYLHLRKHRPDRAWSYLKSWNDLNNPPLPERELYQCFRNVLDKGYVYGCSSLQVIYCDRGKCPLRPFITIPENISGDDWYRKLKRRFKAKLRNL